jgi:hypothetical protein
VLCELRGERRTREVVYTALEEQMMLKQEEKKRRGREGSQRSKEEVSRGFLFDRFTNN